MITAAKARQLIRENTVRLDPVTVSLSEAAEKILAEDIFAPIDIPAYPQSSMDGYAFSYQGWMDSEDLGLFGEVAAGRGDSFELPSGKAVRIFTGAPVPTGADTVVMQEKCSISEDELIIDDPFLKIGDNVRPRGSEITKGSIALEKGSRLSPAAIGFLAGIGITDLTVYPNPVVSIIVTGNELQVPGEPLLYGQVYESNSYSLKAALSKSGVSVSEIYRVEDQLESLRSILMQALLKSDIVLITGGISVGDYDFTLKASLLCGVEQVFHKIKQKPGKPIFFGKKGNKLVFGLPGNPSSVLTCFYEYVLEAISIQQNRNVTLESQNLPLLNTLSKPAGIVQYLKGLHDGKTVRLLDAQESYKLNSFAKANCLIVLHEDIMVCQPNDLVEVHLLP